MAKGLTKRQAAILSYIVSAFRERRMAPTVMEIGSHFGFRSTNAVFQHLSALRKKGYIDRSSKARSIRLTDQAAVRFYQDDVGTLPLVGRIAAGQPILAEENIEGRVAVSAAWAKPGAFCLRVQGDSMIGDGILDGDIIIVDPGAIPSPGDIVVALVNDEATVKRYYLHGDMVELRPANAAMTPLVVPAAYVQVQGVVVALQRRIR